MTTTTHTVDDFAAILLAQTRARMNRDYPTPYPDGTTQADYYVVQVHEGPKYTRVDVGPEHNISGKYMIDNATGEIFGIKGYGRIHRGHRYGTLGTIDSYEWGGYVGQKRQP